MHGPRLCSAPSKRRCAASGARDRCLAMDMAVHPRGCFARALLFASALNLGKGAGKAGCRLAPEVPRVLQKSARGGRQVMPEHPAFPARWFSRCPSCSPRGAMHYCPRRRADDRCAHRSAATSPHDLTHRPRASGPHDFSVRAHPRWALDGWRALTIEAMRRRCQRRVVSRRLLLTGFPPCNPIARRRRRSHRIPARAS